MSDDDARHDRNVSPLPRPEDVRRASFFQLVRLLADTTAVRDHARPGPEFPDLRFKPDMSLGFPAADIVRVDLEQVEDREVHVITTTFMGLYGVSSPLPVVYLMELGAEENRVVRDFLDIINNRLIELFFRVWQRFRFLFQWTPDATDDLSTLLLALVGFHRAALKDQAEFEPRFLLKWAGLLARRPMSRAALETLLRASVHPRVEVEECVLRWVAIPEEQVLRLRVGRVCLGRNCTIGRRIQDRAGMFRVWIGPLSIEEVESFLPGGPGLARLDRVLGLALRDGLDYEVALVLDRSQVRGMYLGRRAPVRLHLTSWLGVPRTSRVVLSIRADGRGNRRVVAGPLQGVRHVNS